MFRSAYIHTDVTCVECFNNYVVAGVGGFLHVFDSSNSNLLVKKKVFEGQKIFGIKPNSHFSKLVIYGGKNIALISWNLENLESSSVVKECVLSDWILDAKWIEDSRKIVTVFMHNTISVWSEKLIKEKSIKCEERCILYSAHLCYSSYKKLLVLSGTVFSDILLWKPFNSSQDGLSPVLKRLKQHKGVIFSLHCNLNNGFICSTSDDRSAILWEIPNMELLDDLSPANSNMLEIRFKCKAYGHMSRVFRCLVLQDLFITAGEDSLLILWNFDGSIVRKIDNHQGGPIWSLCYNTNTDLICSGGNDGAISLFFKAECRVLTNIITLPESDLPKIVALLNSGNLVCLSESALLYYRVNSFRKWEQIAKHEDLQKYSLLQISPCRKLVGLAGFEGQIYIYFETKGSLTLLYKYILQHETRIFSFHWLDCQTFLVSQKDGLISLLFIREKKIHFVQSFTLPQMKEPWSTCACSIGNHVIVGDRKGNIHNFKIGHQKAINTMKNSHNYLGVTNIYSRGDIIISLGRDGFLKRYKLFDEHLQHTDCNKTKFSWLAALESDYLLSFSGNNLLVSDYTFQRVLFQIPCGGGHRSWDYLKSSECFTFTFIKQKTISLISLNIDHTSPKDLIDGYHVREINSLKVLKTNGIEFIISGGEDTTLRLSSIKDGKIDILERFKVHLSSIRTIHTYLLHTKIEDNSAEYLLCTAGGRAQIICWHLHIQDNFKLTCSEKCNFYEPLNKYNIETRIMDISVTHYEKNVFIFAGCSDGSIQIFMLMNDMSLKLHKSILHSHHSITKVSIVITPYVKLLGSMATDGRLLFWSVSSLCDFCKDPSALSSFEIHQSGITSCSHIVKDDKILFLSGGDDNCIILTLFAITKSENCITVSRVSSYKDQSIHCAQITGTYLGDRYFITSSIDQRIVICKWTCTGGNVKFEMLEKYITAIADPQGLECISNDGKLVIYIYGNGMEQLEVASEILNK